MRLAAGGAPVAVKRRAVNWSTKVRTSCTLVVWVAVLNGASCALKIQWTTLKNGSRHVLNLTHPITVPVTVTCYYHSQVPKHVLAICHSAIIVIIIITLLDVHQLLMLFARTLTYLEPGTFSSVILYNML
jgi:hypothetical protein